MEKPRRSRRVLYLDPLEQSEPFEADFGKKESGKKDSGNGNIDERVLQLAALLGRQAAREYVLGLPANDNPPQGQGTRKRNSKRKRPSNSRRKNRTDRHQPVDKRINTTRRDVKP